MASMRPARWSCAAEFFGTHGFTALYFISVHCMRSGVDWMIVGSPAVRRVLSICDPAAELPLADDLSAALLRLDHLAHCHSPAAGRVTGHGRGVVAARR